MRSIEEVKVTGKRILLRTDFNVPMSGREIVDDLRIREALPTVKFLLGKAVSEIIIVTHLGRPQGHDDKFCLWPIANRLIELLDSSKNYYDCAAESYKISDKITMLENIRFNSGEEENDPNFAEFLAGKADFFVNDAFGTCHRAHASTFGVAKILPSYAGLLVQKEVENLKKILNSKLSSFTIILGGAKIKDKLPLIKNFISRADNFLIGGAISNTFLAARNHYLSKSLVEKDDFGKVNQIWRMIMDEADRNIYLPKDLILSRSIEKSQDQRIAKIGDLLRPPKEEFSVVDIGPKTCEMYQDVISKSKLIFWNGNMGVSEVEEFSQGTLKIVEAIACSGAQKYTGGGDTTALIRKLKLDDKFDFISTGGGATLEFLAGKELPGLKVLES